MQLNFNPRTSARYDRRSTSKRSMRQFQSTYLCEVRPDFNSRSFSFRLFQSTYLCEVRPAACMFPRPRREISIHVPLRGTTLCVRLGLQAWYFNPRTSARYDSVRLPKRTTCIYFNPRTSARYDFGLTFVVLTNEFQSTYLCEVRLVSGVLLSWGV